MIRVRVKVWVVHLGSPSGQGSVFCPRTTPMDYPNHNPNHFFRVVHGLGVSVLSITTIHHLHKCIDGRASLVVGKHVSERPHSVKTQIELTNMFSALKSAMENWIVYSTTCYSFNKENHEHMKR